MCRLSWTSFPPGYWSEVTLQGWKSDSSAISLTQLSLHGYSEISEGSGSQFEDETDEDTDIDNEGANAANDVIKIIEGS